MRYPGGKNGAGVYQRIINQVPPHRRYFEPFAGSAAVLRNKRPADVSFAIDRDDAATVELDRLQRMFGGTLHVYTANGIDWLEDRLKRRWFEKTDFIYCDPPYLMSKITTSAPIVRTAIMEYRSAKWVLRIIQVPIFGLMLVASHWHLRNDGQCRVVLEYRRCGRFAVVHGKGKRFRVPIYRHWTLRDLWNFGWLWFHSKPIGGDTDLEVEVRFAAATATNSERIQ